MWPFSRSDDEPPDYSEFESVEIYVPSSVEKAHNEARKAEAEADLAERRRDGVTVLLKDPATKRVINEVDAPIGEAVAVDLGDDVYEVEVRERE